MAKKILLVDDDKIVLRTIEKLLSKEGYEITIAENGTIAMEEARGKPFDLIISDVRMPGVNGIEMVNKIKKNQEEHKFKPSEFMMISGYTDSDAPQRAAQMGILEFLIKPFDKEPFLRAIEKQLAVTAVPLKVEEPSSQTKEAISNQKLIDGCIERLKRKSRELVSNKTSLMLGWYNTYVPEEIICAFGFIPYRIFGSSASISLSKAYISGNLPQNVQSVLECMLRGDYNFLDGVVIGASTDAVKRLYDAVERYTGFRLKHIFDIPKFPNEEGVLHYKESIHCLLEAIEDNFGAKLSNASLNESIRICNQTRKLLGRLNDLRKKDIPPITSRQMLEICKLATISDKGIFNSELEVLIKDIKETDVQKPTSRLLLMGSFQDQPWLLEAIEERGAMIVCEDLCTRYRYFHGLVNEDSEPILALAERYMLKKPLSAALVSLESRINLISNLIDEFKVDGIIYHILKFDDPYLFEYPDMKDFLSSKGVPVLRLETEHTTSALGQIRTRIQAFFETLKLSKLRKIK